MEQVPSQAPTVSEVCDALGRKVMADRLGVKIAAVSNACNDERFPARWFPTIRAMCADVGMECPESLFSFISQSEAKAS